MKQTITPDEIKALRKRAGLTQEEFAAEIGTTARTIHRWETGQTPGRLATRALLQFQAELDTQEPANG